MSRNSGKFPKGKSGNPEGRPKNPARKILREGLTELIPELFDKLKGLDGKDFIDGWAKIAPYALPKLSNIEVGSDQEKGGIVINVVNAKTGDSNTEG